MFCFNFVLPNCSNFGLNVVFSNLIATKVLSYLLLNACSEKYKV